MTKVMVVGDCLRHTQQLNNRKLCWQSYHKKEGTGVDVFSYRASDGAFDNDYNLRFYNYFP